MRLTFDLEVLRFLAFAWADPEKPGAMTGANTLGTATGATRNAAARNDTKKVRDIISSQTGMNIKAPYHGCGLSRYIKTGQCGFRYRPVSQASGRI
jgi:hypothetical protein